MQELGAFDIVLLLFQVLATVQFEDEFLLDANKINDIRPNGMSLAPPARAGVTAKINT